MLKVELHTEDARLNNPSRLKTVTQASVFKTQTNNMRPVEPSSTGDKKSDVDKDSDHKSSSIF